MLAGQARQEAAATCEEKRLKGNACFKEGKHKQAIKYYTTALGLAEDLADGKPAPKGEPTLVAQLSCNRCMAYMALDDHVAALRDAQAAVASAPGWPKAHFRHGKVLTARGSFMEAYGAFKQAWHLDTQNQELVVACQQAHQLMVANDQIRAQLHEQKIARARQAATAPAQSHEAEEPRGLSVEPVGDADAMADGLSLAGLEVGGSASAGTAAPTGQSSQTEEAAGLDVREDVGGTAAAGTQEGAEREGTPAGVSVAGRCAAASCPPEVTHVAAVGRAEDRTAASGTVEAECGGGVRQRGVPQHELSIEEGESRLVVWLPLIEGMAAVELSLSPTHVLVDAAAAYAQLEVPLPHEVDDSAAKARFDKKARKLTVRLPHTGVLV